MSRRAICRNLGLVNVGDRVSAPVSGINRCSGVLADRVRPLKNKALAEHP